MEKENVYSPLFLGQYYFIRVIRMLEQLQTLLGQYYTKYYMVMIEYVFVTLISRLFVIYYV